MESSDFTWMIFRKGSWKKLVHPKLCCIKMRIDNKTSILDVDNHAKIIPNITYFIETRQRRKPWNISFIVNKIEKNFWILNVDLLFLTSRHSSSIMSQYVSCPFGIFQCRIRSTFNRLILTICVNVISENWFYFSKLFYSSLIKLLTKSKFEIMQHESLRNT